jgi:lipopolysaccharide biosynthesis regulator YciM
MSKTDNFEQLKAEYISAYEMVNKKPCPEIVKVKAWIKVGDISFRPDDFEKSLKTLQLRSSNNGEIRKEVESKLNLDVQLLDQSKESLQETLNRLKKLTLCEGIEIENMIEMLEKCNTLIDVSKKRNIV